MLRHHVVQRGEEPCFALKDRDDQPKVHELVAARRANLDSMPSLGSFALICMHRRKFSIESVSVLLQALTCMRHPDGYLLGGTATWMIVHKLLRLKDRNRTHIIAHYTFFEPIAFCT